MDIEGYQLWLAFGRLNKLLQKCGVPWVIIGYLGKAGIRSRAEGDKCIGWPALPAGILAKMRVGLAHPIGGLPCGEFRHQFPGEKATLIRRGHKEKLNLSNVTELIQRATQWVLENN